MIWSLGGSRLAALFFIVNSLVPQVGASGMEEFERLSLLLPDQCEYAGTFNQSRYLPALPAPLQSSGQFLFSCNRGLVWKTLLPIHETIVYLPVPLMIRINGENQPQVVNGIVQLKLGQLLLGLMSGNSGYLLDTFSLSPTSRLKQLELVPRMATLSRHIDNIQIHPQESTTTSTVNYRNGGATVISTQDFNVLNEFSENQCNEVINDAAVACELLFNQNTIDALIETER